MKTCKIIVSGIVQGVGFRYFTFRLAEEYNLKGWVRNNLNGTVEMIVSGEEDNGCPAACSVFSLEDVTSMHLKWQSLSRSNLRQEWRCGV